MDKDRELDELISKYTDDLIKLKEKWAKLGIDTRDKIADVPQSSEPKEDKENQDLTEEINIISEPENQIEITEENTEPSDTEQSSDNDIISFEEIPLSNPENFALFSARVFSGNQAYPVANAKISVFCDGKLHIFLITDENGKTKKVKLQSYPAINAFIPESTNQILDYTADVYADGFSPRKGLLVSAVGGSDILLNVKMTPVSERID